ncbi:hypothetical protein SDC9_60820 [bioreactor metagenome]|uniref:Uncharacterized protein n=1 Tax=bioreactor metagenome TaxID=1076179 RepID=A0A644XF99_9ZZZZ
MSQPGDGQSRCSHIRVLERRAQKLEPGRAITARTAATDRRYTLLDDTWRGGVADGETEEDAIRRLAPVLEALFSQAVAIRAAGGSAGAAPR